MSYVGQEGSTNNRENESRPLNQDGKNKIDTGQAGQRKRGGRGQRSRGKTYAGKIDRTQPNPSGNDRQSDHQGLNWQQQQLVSGRYSNTDNGQQPNGRNSKQTQSVEQGISNGYSTEKSSKGFDQSGRNYKESSYKNDKSSGAYSAKETQSAVGRKQSGSSRTGHLDTRDNGYDYNEYNEFNETEENEPRKLYGRNNQRYQNLDRNSHVRSDFGSQGVSERKTRDAEHGSQTELDGRARNMEYYTQRKACGCAKDSISARERVFDRRPRDMEYRDMEYDTQKTHDRRTKDTDYGSERRDGRARGGYGGSQEDYNGRASDNFQQRSSDGRFNDLEKISQTKYDGSSARNGYYDDRRESTENYNSSCREQPGNPGAARNDFERDEEYLRGERNGKSNSDFYETKKQSFDEVHNDRRQRQNGVGMLKKGQNDVENGRNGGAATYEDSLERIEEEKQLRQKSRVDQHKGSISTDTVLSFSSGSTRSSNSDQEWSRDEGSVQPKFANTRNAQRDERMKEEHSSNSSKSRCRDDYYYDASPGKSGSSGDSGRSGFRKTQSRPARNLVQDETQRGNPEH